MEAPTLSGEPHVPNAGVGSNGTTNADITIQPQPPVSGEYDPTAAYNPLDMSSTSSATVLLNSNNNIINDPNSSIATFAQGSMHAQQQQLDMHAHHLALQQQATATSLPISDPQSLQTADQQQQHQLAQAQQQFQQHFQQQSQSQQLQPPAHLEHQHQAQQNPDTAGYQPQPLAQTSYKVFCGGLSFQTDEDKLREYFERLGTVVDVVIMRDRMSGHPRGFGFVSFAEESVAKDVASRRHDIDGRQVEAKIAIPRNQVPSTSNTGGVRNGNPRHVGSDGSMGSGGVGGMSGGVLMSSSVGTSMGSTQMGSRPNSSHLNKIFVGGLPSQVGEAEFSAYFSRFGEVVDAQVMIDHQTGNSRGFGFISFADQASVEAVVGPGRSNTRHEIMGKTVEVKRAEPKGTTGDRRNRENYSGNVGGGGAGGGVQRGQYGSMTTGVGGMVAGGTNAANPAANIGAGSLANAAAATAGAYAGYNYPASIMEQYGAYYNNPQWQQYYAAMGYNMSAYPQGFNPYTYYAAYMNNAAAANAATNTVNPEADGSGLVAGNVATAAENSGLAAQTGDAQNRGGYNNAVGGNGTASGAGVGGAVSGGVGNVPGTGVSIPATRRTSRRDDRYHPYR